MVVRGLNALHRLHKAHLFVQHPKQPDNNLHSLGFLECHPLHSYQNLPRHLSKIRAAKKKQKQQKKPSSSNKKNFSAADHFQDHINSNKEDEEGLNEVEDFVDEQEAIALHNSCKIEKYPVSITIPSKLPQFNARLMDIVLKRQFQTGCLWRPEIPDELSTKYQFILTKMNDKKLCLFANLERDVWITLFPISLFRTLKPKSWEPTLGPESDNYFLSFVVDAECFKRFNRDYTAASLQAARRLRTPYAMQQIEQQQVQQTATSVEIMQIDDDENEETIPTIEPTLPTDNVEEDSMTVITAANTAAAAAPLPQQQQQQTRVDYTSFVINLLQSGYQQYNQPLIGSQLDIGSGVESQVGTNIGETSDITIDWIKSFIAAMKEMPIEEFMKNRRAYEQLKWAQPDNFTRAVNKLHFYLDCGSRYAPITLDATEAQPLMQQLNKQAKAIYQVEQPEMLANANRSFMQDEAGLQLFFGNIQIEGDSQLFAHNNDVISGIV